MLSENFNKNNFNKIEESEIKILRKRIMELEITNKNLSQELTDLEYNTNIEIDELLNEINELSGED